MHHRHHGTGTVAARAVETDQRGVAELVLEQEIQVRRHPGRQRAVLKVEGQPPEIIQAGQTQYHHRVPPFLQGGDHFPVVEVATRQGVQAAVDHKPDLHRKRSR